MDFAQLEKTDVTKNIEKKNRFSYLSWPFAVSEFRKSCPSGTWEVKRHNGSPVLTTYQGHFIEVEVTPDVMQPELRFSQIHPVLDNTNKPITAPNAFQVNTSIQRCLVKAIAIATGIGLHIYAGEDLPPGEEPEPKKAPTPDPMELQCLADFKEAMDKCLTVAELEQYAKEKGDDIKASLTGNNLTAVYAHFNGVKKGLQAIGA